VQDGGRRLPTDAFCCARILQGTTVDNPGKLDIFIVNMKHSEYVKRVTRDERHQRSLIHKHQGDHLLENFNSVLMNSDSPTKNEAAGASRPICALTTPT